MIPKTFQLAGLTVKVEIDHDLYQKRGIVGEARYPSQTIALDPTLVSRESLEQNFYHELVHWFFFMMNEHELRQNERIVDLLAHFLYQQQKTQAGSFEDEELKPLVR
jgi:predicted SprT family Zn-dependent metalloprotease